LSQVSIVKPITLSMTKTQHPQHIISSALRPVTLSLTGLRRLAATARSGKSRDGACDDSHDKTLIVFVSILGPGFGFCCGPKFYRFKNSIWKSSASLATFDRSPLVLHLFLFRISLDQKIQKPSIYLCNDFGFGP
ncbi:unnamed protein product, partial [Brassica oleracea]